MTDYNITETNIDTIVAKIRKEAERIKSEPILPNRVNKNYLKHNPKNSIFAQRKETGLWKTIKKTQYKLQKYDFYSAVYKIAVKFKTIVPKYKK
jgi:hypothetical protein